MNGSTADIAGAYTNREVPFTFRGADFTFALSLGLFSSAGIDAGTRLLLKILSQELDALPAGGLPRRVLDAGCGAGIIGVCAARALAEMGGGGNPDGPAPALHVRAQDRDALAALFTAFNARRNGIAPETLSAHTEPLLAVPPGSRWDLILSNIPAKAGRPVLEDFVPRSLGLLAPGGRTLLVVVNTLAGFFRTLTAGAGGLLLREAAGSGHTVFVYGNIPARGGTAGSEAAEVKAETGGGGPAADGAVKTGADFLKSHPFYLRQRARYRIEGTAYALDTVHGAPLFDNPGTAVQAAAKLFIRLKDHDCGAGPLLFHECAQGHFPLWFLEYGKEQGRGATAGSGETGPAVTLSGRNILSLEAAAHNIRTALASAPPDGAGPPAIRIVPAVEPGAVLPEDPAFSFIAAFPEPVPRTERTAAFWEAFSRLLRPGGLLLLTLPSPEAEKFDRKKPGAYVRAGDLRRGGFRALGYRKTPAADPADR
ncbi:MAG: methyltransferase [Treponema sp.]|nr:methyltransferase [Treponema sp.]